MAAKLYGADNAPLKIQFITDPHYYSRKGGTEGKAYEKAEAKSQKIIKDSDQSRVRFAVCGHFHGYCGAGRRYHPGRRAGLSRRVY